MGPKRLQITRDKSAHICRHRCNSGLVDCWGISSRGTTEKPFVSLARTPSRGILKMADPIAPAPVRWPLSSLAGQDSGQRQRRPPCAINAVDKRRAAEQRMPPYRFLARLACAAVYRFCAGMSRDSTDSRERSRIVALGGRVWHNQRGDLRVRLLKSVRFGSGIGTRVSLSKMNSTRRSGASHDCAKPGSATL
jgi:hypothetical protein